MCWCCVSAVLWLLLWEEEDVVDVGEGDGDGEEDLSGDVGGDVGSVQISGGDVFIFESFVVFLLAFSFFLSFFLSGFVRDA